MTILSDIMSAYDGLQKFRNEIRGPNTPRRDFYRAGLFYGGAIAESAVGFMFDQMIDDNNFITPLAYTVAKISVVIGVAYGLKGTARVLSQKKTSTKTP